jgi:HAD superfamily hydrolase (TIGR01509 family)
MRKIEVPDFVQGLIFDCDGTLVDSMPLHMKAWEHVIRSNGGPWDIQFFLAKKGMPEERIVALYNAHYAKTLNPRETVRAKHAFFKNYPAEFKPIPNVVNVVLENSGIRPMAVVSGGVREIVTLELDSLGIRDCFQTILTADDPIKPKPAPDIFLEAALRIRISPEKCQVFEDGDLGLEAGRLAGMLPTDIRLFL